MVKHLQITIKGKVQKSGYRFSAILLAQELELTGFVEYLPDGSVHIEAQGEVENLKKFLSWCHRGPENAKIDKVEYASSEKLKEFNGFISKEEKAFEA